MLTGYRAQQAAVRYPCLGSLLSKELGDNEGDLPNYVSLSPFRMVDAGFLGPNFSPLMVSGASDDPNTRANLALEDLAPPRGLDEEAMRKQFDFLRFMQQEFEEEHRGAAAKAHKASYDKAMRMIETQARKAFELDDEPTELRDAYGRNRFGQSCLLARRLVERGVAFVEVALSSAPGNVAGWDTHSDNFTQVRALSQVLDPAWATLMKDLRDRGMLESTLVVWMGEFGRTPKINPTTGRDHFPAAWSVVLGGAGVKGGQAIGSTGKGGDEVTDRPVSVGDLYATICTALGINPTKENMTPEGRPISLVDKGSKPIAELVG
jgi:arylsulfatase A-like enzyme